MKLTIAQVLLVLLGTAQALTLTEGPSARLARAASLDARGGGAQDNKPVAVWDDKDAGLSKPGAKPDAAKTWRPAPDTKKPSLTKPKLLPLFGNGNPNAATNGKSGGNGYRKSSGKRSPEPGRNSNKRPEMWRPAPGAKKPSHPQDKTFPLFGKGNPSTGKSGGYGYKKSGGYVDKNGKPGKTQTSWPNRVD